MIVLSQTNASPVFTFGSFLQDNDFADKFMSLIIVCCHLATPPPLFFGYMGLQEVTEVSYSQISHQ